VFQPFNINYYSPLFFSYFLLFYPELASNKEQESNRKRETEKEKRREGKEKNGNETSIKHVLNIGQPRFNRNLTLL